MKNFKKFLILKEMKNFKNIKMVSESTGFKIREVDKIVRESFLRKVKFGSPVDSAKKLLPDINFDNTEYFFSEKPINLGTKVEIGDFDVNINIFSVIGPGGKSKKFMKDRGGDVISPDDCVVYKCSCVAFRDGVELDEKEFGIFYYNSYDLKISDTYLGCLGKDGNAQLTKSINSLAYQLIIKTLPDDFWSARIDMN